MNAGLELLNLAVQAGATPPAMLPAAAPPPPAGPSLAGSGMITFVLASAVVIALAYAASQLLSKWQKVQNRGRRLRVLEGVPVGKDRSLMLVAVGKEVLVIGASQGGIHLVHRVEDTKAAAELLAEPDTEGAKDLKVLEADIRGNLERMRTLLSRQGGRSNA